MTVIFPDGIQQEGNTSVAVIQTMASPGVPSMATDIGAASTVIVSCYLYSGGMPTKTVNKGTRPRRVCSKSDKQAFGVKTYDITDLQYVYDPQALITAAVNKARGALTEGSTVFVLIRRGLDAQTSAFAIGQKVDVWKVTLGPQNKTTTGDGEFDEFTITQSVIVVTDPWEDVAIAA